MLEIVLLSLLVAATASLMTLPLAIAVGRYLARAPFGMKVLVSALSQAPLVLPPVVTGYFLLILFGRRGWIGSWLDEVGITIAFSWVGAALAAAIMAFPLILRPIRLSFEQQDRRLEEMAATLGAGRWARFLRIALPLAWPGIVAGTILGFAKALGEFGATITFVSNIPGETRTISLAIYTLLQSPNGDRSALVLIAISVAISLGAVVLSEWLVLRWRKKDDADAS